VQDACGCYYWALRLSDKVGADPPALVRRLGGGLNQRGRLALVAGELRAAEASFRDAFAAFSHASDPVNAALVLVNHATVCRSRARSKQRARSSCRSATLQALVAAGAAVLEEVPSAEEVEQLAEAARQQRRAVDAIRPLRGAQPSFYLASVRQLADDERDELGLTLLAAIERSAERGAERGAERAEPAFGRAAESLGRAQALNEELGEAARAQEMARWQGFLYLVGARRERGGGGGRGRTTASSRLTLALRHYDRALSPPAEGSASAAMEECAAACRLDLATFYLSSSGAGAGATAAAGTAGGGHRARLESGLTHARAGLSLLQGRPVASGGGDADDSLVASLRRDLADAAERLLRELIRATAVAGNSSRAETLKEEYRALLSSRTDPKSR